MARNSGHEENWECSNSEEEEEETLSLCDLPVTGENQSRKEGQAFKAEEEEFEFGSWGGSLVTEPEMCVADDVFFQGQILPLRLSVSSDTGLAGIPKDSRNTSMCVSRSDSMDHSSSGGVTSVSSRSSSIRSHHSSSSTNSTTPTTTTYKSRVRNQFHTHPSPKPQIRVSGGRPASVGNRSQKSTMWGLFRLGLVRTPEIELQDLKLRNKKGSESRSSSTSSSSFSEKNSRDEVNLEEKKKERLLEKRSGFMSGCKCSVKAVETVPSSIVIIKSSNKQIKLASTDQREAREGKQKQQHGKQAMSGRRTFEWLKELSIAGAPDEA